MHSTAYGARPIRRSTYRAMLFHSRARRTMPMRTRTHRTLPIHGRAYRARSARLKIVSMIAAGSISLLSLSLLYYFHSATRVRVEAQSTLRGTSVKQSASREAATKPAVPREADAQPSLPRPVDEDQTVSREGGAQPSAPHKTAMTESGLREAESQEALPRQTGANQGTSRDGNSEPVVEFQALLPELVRLPPPRPLHLSFAQPVPAGLKLIAEARKYLNTNPTPLKQLWCARFMNFILAKLGYSGTNSDAARSFLHYGERILGPRIGAIAVLSRGKYGGHVGVVTAVDRHGNPMLISGNAGRRVRIGLYPHSRVLAYVAPPTLKAATSTKNKSIIRTTSP